MSKIYRVSEFAKRIGKSANTLRRWDNEGRLVARRMPSGHRYYTEDDIYKALGTRANKLISLEGNNGGDVLEIRVLPDGRIGLKVDHCCVVEINHIVPVEFVTAVLSKAVIDAGGMNEAMRSIGWSQDYIDKLVSQIEII